jgi:hypothetical protein
VPQLDVSDWTPEAIADQITRLDLAGAEPTVTVVIHWKSAAERARDAQDRADEQHCRNLAAEGLKGGGKSYAAKLSG